MIDLEVYIGNSKLDLFDDENVTLKRSVKNYREIDKLFSDYSQTFSIPASKNNNVIMEHWYDSDVQQTFNPSSKKSARLEINKHLFKKGFIKYESSKIRALRIKINHIGSIPTAPAPSGRRAAMRADKTPRSATDFASRAELEICTITKKNATVRAAQKNSCVRGSD